MRRRADKVRRMIKQSDIKYRGVCNNAILRTMREVDSAYIELLRRVLLNQTVSTIRLHTGFTPEFISMQKLIPKEVIRAMLYVKEV